MSAVVTRIEGEATERSIALHIVKHGLWVAPVMVAISFAIWGAAGAASCAYGIALVCVNFLLAAALITYTARISLGLMMGAVLFGYLLRLGLIFLAVLLVRHAVWVEPVPLGITLIVTHLGLLVWEMKYVAASLAFHGLKPSTQGRTKT